MDHSSKHLGRLNPHLNLIVGQASENQSNNLFLQIIVRCRGAAEKYKVVENDRLEEVQGGKASPPASELRGGLNGGKSRGQRGEG